MSRASAGVVGAGARTAPGAGVAAGECVVRAVVPNVAGAGSRVDTIGEYAAGPGLEAAGG